MASMSDCLVVRSWPERGKISPFNTCNQSHKFLLNTMGSLPEDRKKQNMTRRESSAARRAKRRESKFWRYFLAFRPVVVGVAFGATRLGAVKTWCVAGLANRNSRQQNVFRLRAGQRVRVAAHASEATMGVVIESCV